jgi:uncharacterized RmlC-like cupin family protein
MANDAFATIPAEIVWETSYADGSKSATLIGTRDPGVQFTYAFFIPAGLWDQPHSHPADAHLHVASGALAIGYGDKFEPEVAVRHPAGSFIFVPAGLTHFDGSDQDTILIGTATGPWSTDYMSG